MSMVALAGYDECGQVCLAGYAAPCDDKGKRQRKHPQEYIYTQYIWAVLRIHSYKIIQNNTQIVMNTSDKHTFASILDMFSIQKPVKKPAKIVMNGTQTTPLYCEISLFSYDEHSKEIVFNLHGTITRHVRDKMHANMSLPHLLFSVGEI